MRPVSVVVSDELGQDRTSVPRSSSGAHHCGSRRYGGQRRAARSRAGHGAGSRYCFRPSAFRPGSSSAGWRAAVRWSAFADHLLLQLPDALLPIAEQGVRVSGMNVDGHGARCSVQIESADSASPTPLIRAGVSLAPDSEWPGRESKPRRPARNGRPEPSRLLFLLTVRYRESRQRSTGHQLQCRGSEQARELGRHLGNGPGADAHGAAIFVRDKVLATPSGVLL